MTRAVFLQNHVGKIARSVLFQVILLGIRLVPRPERAAEYDAIAVREKHLSSTASMALLIWIFLVSEPHIADTRADIGELPGFSPALVVGGGAKLPSNGCRIFYASLRFFAISLEESIRCKCG